MVLFPLKWGGFTTATVGLFPSEKEKKKKVVQRGRPSNRVLDMNRTQTSKLPIQTTDQGFIGVKITRNQNPIHQRAQHKNHITRKKKGGTPPQLTQHLGVKITGKRKNTTQWVNPTPAPPTPWPPKAPTPPPPTHGSFRSAVAKPIEGTEASQSTSKQPPHVDVAR